LNPNKWNLFQSGITGGTVTSIATNNGTGISGGTITTTGTLLIDTVNIGTRLWRLKGTDSVSGLVTVVNTRLTDTSSVLRALANSKYTGGTVTSVATNAGSGITGGTITGTGTLVIDTLNIATRLWRQKGIDSVMGQVNLKVNISDTSTMLNPYIRKTNLATFGVTSITGTTNQVIASASTGAVTLSLPQSIATTSDVVFGKVTSFRTPTLGTYYFGNNTDSINSSAGQLTYNTKPFIFANDTASMLSNLLRKTDTLTMLSGYKNLLSKNSHIGNYYRDKRCGFI